VIYTEETVREVKPNVQIARLIVRLGEKLVDSAGLPPAEAQVETQTEELERQNAQLRAANEHEELTLAAEDLAGRRKSREELKEKQMRAEMGNPRWDEDLSTPERWGYWFARKYLTEVAAGRASLADAEALNQYSSRSNGAVYPSYFEICDENINGVRVAKWVRELVPEPRLPKDEEAFLPCLHNLRQFDPHMRQVLPYGSKIVYEGASMHRFGPLETDPHENEPEAAQSASPASAAKYDVNESLASDEDPAAQEQHALAELSRTFRMNVWAERANNMVPNLLSEGKSNLFYQGYTREQYEALLAWERVMQRRENEQKAAEIAKEPQLA